MKMKSKILMLILILILLPITVNTAYAAEPSINGYPAEGTPVISVDPPHQEVNIAETFYPR